MSYDLGVWYPHEKIDNAEAGKRYGQLCEGDTSGVKANPAVDAFYAELTAKHPEIDTIPDDRIDDHDYCPWSCAHPPLAGARGHVLHLAESALRRAAGDRSWLANMAWRSTTRNPT